MNFNPTGKQCESTPPKDATNPQPSTSQGGAGAHSNITNESSGGSEIQSKSLGKSHHEISVEDKIYGLNDCHRGYVYMLNNLEGCKEDIKILEDKFSQLGFEITHIKEVDSYQSLEKKMSENYKSKPSTVVVVFFGFGYEDNLFIGKNENESVSAMKFLQAFNINKGPNNASILFTNTCFKYKSRNTRELPKPNEPLWDTFHVCVKVNGECLNGSLLTKALLEELEENESEQEFGTFSQKVTCRIDDLDEDDIYITEVGYYGVRKCYYFAPPSKVRST